MLSIVFHLQYWPNYYDLLLEQNGKIKNITKTNLHIEKKFTVVVRDTNEEENAENLILPFEKNWGEIGFENTSKSLFPMNKKFFFLHFSKKLVL